MADSKSKILEFLTIYKDPQTGECTPAVWKIAEAVNLSDGHVRRLLRQLAKEGFIEIQERWKATEDPYGDANSETMERTSNLYRFVPEKRAATNHLLRSDIMSTFTGLYSSLRARFWHPEMLVFSLHMI